VIARRRMMPLAAMALLQLAWGRPPLAAPKTDTWTPERVRAFVLKVEREMEAVQTIEGEVKIPRMEEPCWGRSADLGIKKSVVYRRLDNYLEGHAALCYVLTYLGCPMGEWIARPLGNFPGPLYKPFKRSKVTIIEQTADRVVADMTELYFEDDFDGDAKWYVGEDHVEPFTEAEIAAVKDSSRYTITRGKDGVWRISDRKPTFRSTDKPDGTPPKVIGP